MELLSDVDLVVCEKSPEIGAAWYENSQFSWDKNPIWSKFFSGSKAIWQYFKDAATKHDLEKHIKFHCVVKSAPWNEELDIWKLIIIDTDKDCFEDTCHILLKASGIQNQVSSWTWPYIPGFHGFKGKLIRTANWDASFDLDGKTVAAIGSEWSGVQLIPAIQPDQHAAQSVTNELVKAQLGNNAALAADFTPSFGIGCRRPTPGDGFLGALTAGNFQVTLEWLVRYVCQVIEKIQTENFKAVEPKEEAVRDLYHHTHEVMKRLVFGSVCRSWFKDGKSHGPLTAMYADSRFHYYKATKNVRWEGYGITYWTENRFRHMGNGLTETHLKSEKLAKPLPLLAL
ncbi:hypothetical protein MAC_05479 [Metarhizium acridum CQMa 102]|uniref:Uncharacterized protein n=1 Tax=Metarhizium acridum (strain CQMa 102) TaxID=655827 RepID=E9E6I1_METAQ|nr:uncharacterized protein MAC_05479 [Metarhizium acridum CQMa 102]EFY88427.1 hypothetical protein MAC_05479 [Metarhizium acridum CQMa 102]